MVLSSMLSTKSRERFLTIATQDWGHCSRLNSGLPFLTLMSLGAIPASSPQMNFHVIRQCELSPVYLLAANKLT
jgi:hypothetical protein